MADSPWQRFKNTMGELLDATGPSGAVAALLVKPSERAVVGRQLLHKARARKDPAWPQYTTDHTVQMWFQLVHAVPYGKRPDDAVLAADEALTGAQLGELYAFVRPYYRHYVEAYRVPEMIKWDIMHKRRPPMDQQTQGGVLTAAFEKQANEDRERSYPLRPMGLKRAR